MVEDRLAEELEDYLSKRGTVELLCEINQSGSRYGELSEALDISTSTLTKRLKEGQDVLVIEMQAARRNRSPVNEYTLTKRGFRILYHMMDTNAIGAYQLYREAQAKFEEKAEEVCEWTAANSDQLTKEPHSIPGPDFFSDFEDQSENSDESSD